MQSLHVRGMKGMGDNLYLRPFIRAQTRKYRVFLETPFEGGRHQRRIDKIAGLERC